MGDKSRTRLLLVFILGVRELTRDGVARREPGDEAGALISPFEWVVPSGSYRIDPPRASFGNKPATFKPSKYSVTPTSKPLDTTTVRRTSPNDSASYR